jgi:small-conductance mechanosensitive channel
MKPWLIALVVLVLCIVVGAVLSSIVRRQVDKPDRPDALREVAPILASFVFWVFVAFGVLFAVAQSSPGSLDHLPATLVGFVPRVIVAGVLIIAGKVLGSLVGMAAGRAVLKATGARRKSVERLISAAIVALAALVGVAQIGIDTAIVNLVLAAVLASLALSAALLVGLGGRQLSSNLAAGRYLSGVIKPGWTVRTGDISGRVVSLRPASLEVQNDDGSIVFIPNADVMGAPLHVLGSPDNSSSR